MKNMNKKTKNAFLIALSAIAAVSLSAGVGAVSAAAENDAAKLETYATGGAAIRITGNWGIRFQTLMEEADYLDMTAENSGFVTGILAIPADMLDDPNDLTLENENAENAVTFDGEINRWRLCEDETKYESFAFLDGNDIPSLSYSRNLSFRGYYTIGGNTVYGDVVNRSMTYVAQAELEDDAKATAENAENKDLILDDEQEVKAQSYIKDYTVAYVDGVTNKLITTQTVVAGDSVADNKVSGDVADPTLFGGVFAGWTKQGATWQGEEELLTGDTVVKANYTAATELDFSKATEVPLYLATNHNATGLAKEMRIENGALYGSKWSMDTFTISFLDEITLEKGDKLIIEVDATQDKWFQINLKSATESTTIFNQTTEIRANATFDNAANYIRVREYCGIYYEAPEGGLTFQTVEFVHAQAISLEFYVKSIKVEKAVALTEYDYYNVDFSQLDAIPSGMIASSSVNKKALYDATEDALWIGEQRGGSTYNIQLAFPNIVLEEGDILSLTMKAVMGGCNVKLNTTSIAPSGWWFGVGDYKTVTYTVPAGGMTLSNITLLSYNANGGGEYYVKNVKIMKGSLAESLNFDDLGNAANAYLGAFTHNGSKTATLVEDATYGTVLKQSGMWANNSDGTPRGLIVSFGDLKFENATTLTVLLKLEGTSSAHNWLAAGINGTENTDGCNTPNGEWMEVTVDIPAGTTLSTLYLNSTTTANSFNLYVASITIN